MKWIFNKKPAKRSLDEIYGFFQNMENNGVFIHQKFLWTFFYDNDSKKELEILKKDLKTIGFTNFEILKEANIYTLHANLISEFTEESFYEFYLKCYYLGKEKKLKGYGDFDVGNKKPLLPIERDDKFPGIKWIVKKPKVDGFPRVDVINGAFMNFKYKKEFPYGLYVTIYFEADNRRKLPNKKQIKEIEKFEIQLKKKLRIYCTSYWIYRMTWDEDRTNYFQVDNILNAEKAIFELQKMYSDQVKIHSDFDFDPNWEQVIKMITY